MWVLFSAPCPTPDGQTAQDLYEKRLTWISDEMRASARDLGCTFHRAWYARDGSAFYALAHWRTREGAHAWSGAKAQFIPALIWTTLTRRPRLKSGASIQNTFLKRRAAWQLYLICTVNNCEPDTT